MLAARGERWQLWQVLTAAGSLVVVVCSVLPALFTRPKTVWDSASYLVGPSIHSGRLPVVPLLFDALGRDLKAICVAQALIGGACWCFLVSEAARARNHVAAVLSVAAIVVMACSTYVVEWYAAVLSDSLSISLLVLVLALLARWLRTRTSLWPLVIGCCVWAMTRPTNAYVLLAGAAVLVPVALHRARRSLPQLICVIAVASSAAFLAGQGQLWEQPFLHSLTERFLPDPTLRGWFESHGMPVTPALEQLAGPYFPSTDEALRTNPELSSFRSWMESSGQTTYAEFLATHIPWTLDGTFSLHEELGPGLIAYYGGELSRPWYPAGLRNVFLSDRQPDLILLLALDGIVVLFLGFQRRLAEVRFPIMVWAGVVGLGLLTLVIDWAGDSWEVGRHSLDGTLTVALAAVMLAACCPPNVARSRPRSAEVPLPQPATEPCLPSDRVPS